MVAPVDGERTVAIVQHALRGIDARLQVLVGCVLRRMGVIPQHRLAPAALVLEQHAADLGHGVCDLARRMRIQVDVVPAGRRLIGARQLCHLSHVGLIQVHVSAVLLLLFRRDGPEGNHLVGDLHAAPV